MSKISNLIAGIVLLATFQNIYSKEQEVTNTRELLTTLYLEGQDKLMLYFYFFNLTNPDDFLEGEKPIFREIGPYAYKTTLRKDDVRWVNRSIIEFAERKIARYHPRESRGNRQYDKVTTINVPLITALYKMKYGDKFARKAIASFAETLGQKPYVTRTIREMLWGYENELLGLDKAVGQFLSPDNIYPFDKFGLFMGKNDTNLGTLRVASGLDDFGYFGEVKGWREHNESEMDDSIGFWATGTQCNKAMGSNGQVFPPNLTKNKKLYLFSRDFCRTFKGSYQKDVEGANGTPCYRFVPDQDIFGTVEENPEDSCFCNDKGEGCSKISGIFNMSSCQFGAPMMFSWPHFFQADKTLLNDIRGLSPDSKKHQTFIDIEKKLGMTMNFRFTAQLNIALEKMEEV